MGGSYNYPWNNQNAYATTIIFQNTYDSTLKSFAVRNFQCRGDENKRTGGGKLCL